MLSSRCIMFWSVHKAVRAQQAAHPVSSVVLAAESLASSETAEPQPHLHLERANIIGQLSCRGCQASRLQPCAAEYFFHLNSDLLFETQCCALEAQATKEHTRSL